MKQYFKLAAVLSVCLAIVSCGGNSRKKALLPNISGKAGEVIVVIDKGEWEGMVGTAIRDTLTDDCPFLPQREAMFTLVDVIPGGFSNIFKMHRNILIVNIDPKVTEPGVIFKKDVWAAPQCVIKLNAPNSEVAAELFRQNSSKIVTTIEQAERDRIIANAKKYEERSLAPVVTAMAGGSPHFPSGYKLKKKTDDFIWISLESQVMQGILIYRYPVEEGKEMMDLDNILEVNAQVLKDNVPGMFENTYMITNMQAKPSIEYIRYNGRDFAQIKGLWEVENDYMGGPFVTHVFYSKDGSHMIAMEGFVYAPKYDKRQYMRQVESVLYSYEWAAEEKSEK